MVYTSSTGAISKNVSKKNMRKFKTALLYQQCPFHVNYGRNN